MNNFGRKELKIAPCKDCSERFTACHDHCPKDNRGEIGYKAWKSMIKTERKEKRDFERKLLMNLNDF